jgi:hypothetical protein
VHRLPCHRGGLPGPKVVGNNPVDNHCAHGVDSARVVLGEHVEQTRRPTEPRAQGSIGCRQDK